MPRAAVPDVRRYGRWPGAGSTGCGVSVELSRGGPASLEAPASPLTGVPQPGSGSQARYWRACTAALYLRDRAVGGTALLPSALQQWQRAVPTVQGTSAQANVNGPDMAVSA
jgi:hypothetical protein